jgi:phage N-6-adenine-methyltransferase
LTAAETIARKLQKDEQLAALTAAEKADKRRGGFLANGSFTGNWEWYTPVEYIELARSVMGAIDLDPASTAIAQHTVKAATFHTTADNGLSQEWRGRIWLNPPYSYPEIEQFVDKLVDEIEAAHVAEAIMLTNNASDTAWFHKAVRVADAMCFTLGRIRFLNQGGDRSSPAQGRPSARRCESRHALMDRTQS